MMKIVYEPFSNKSIKYLSSHFSFHFTIWKDIKPPEISIMLNIPSSLRTQFEAGLQEKAIPKNNQAVYQKGLCYYLDF